MSLTGGWLSDWAGLTTAEIAAALSELERTHRIAPGSRAAGRADLLTPDVLGAIGLGAWSLGWDVLPDVPAVGGGIAARCELVPSGDDLCESWEHAACAGQTAAAA